MLTTSTAISHGAGLDIPLLEDISFLPYQSKTITFPLATETGLESQVHIYARSSTLLKWELLVLPRAVENGSSVVDVVITNITDHNVNVPSGTKIIQAVAKPKRHMVSSTSRDARLYIRENLTDETDRVVYLRSDERDYTTLYSNETIEVTQGQVFIVATGTHMSYLDVVDEYMDIVGIHSVSENGFIVNHGVVDSDYKGQLYVTGFGTKPMTINKGDAIARIFCQRLDRPKVVHLTEEEWKKIITKRNTKGFGSTDRGAADGSPQPDSEFFIPSEFYEMSRDQIDHDLEDETVPDIDKRAMCKLLIIRYVRKWSPAKFQKEFDRKYLILLPHQIDEAIAEGVRLHHIDQQLQDEDVIPVTSGYKDFRHVGDQIMSLCSAAEVKSFLETLGVIEVNFYKKDGTPNYDIFAKNGKILIRKGIIFPKRLVPTKMMLKKALYHQNDLSNITFRVIKTETENLEHIECSAAKKARMDVCEMFPPKEVGKRLQTLLIEDTHLPIPGIKPAAGGYFYSKHLIPKKMAIQLQLMDISEMTMQGFEKIAGKDRESFQKLFNFKMSLDEKKKKRGVKSARTVMSSEDSEMEIAQTRQEDPKGPFDELIEAVLS